MAYEIWTMCPRCGGASMAAVSEPWFRSQDTTPRWVEWVTFRQHEHGRTGRSLCRPKGFARESKVVCIWPRRAAA